MAKSKKGRATANPTEPSQPGRSSLRQAIEKAKRNLAKSDEIDVSTLADDDPAPLTRNKARGFATLMQEDSSDDDTIDTNKCDTPRKGDDKKRQRFAKETEVITVEQDDADDSIAFEVPTPVRLLNDPMDTDSVQPTKAVTIAEILGEGPDVVLALQQPFIINKDCRYNFQIKVVACESPTQFVAKKCIDFFAWVQEKIGKNISIATWNDAQDKQKVYNRPTQLPATTDTSAWTAIWGNWIAIKPQQEGTAFLKVRFITKSPDALTKRLTDIGELRDEGKALTGIHIGRLPIPWQAVQVGCAGWLFGSNKHINSNDLGQEISRLINLPPHVRMGISWRAIKLETGRNPPWTDNVPPASALHIDIDWLHGPVYKAALANLFKKHGSIKPLGLTMRLIPCFSSDEGKNSTNEQRTAAIEMRDKQDFLIKEHITTIKTPYILNLDKATKPNGNMTLRRYLKNLHPQGLVAARLVLSVDKAWQEGSKDTIIVTTREYAPQVHDAIRNMIPECVHRFGNGVKGWFTQEGLLAFKGVQWDPRNQKSVSDKDIEALRTVTEDYFGMGDAWRKKQHTSQRPGEMDKNPTASPTVGTPEASILPSQGKQPITADTLLADTLNRKSDAPSFGDLYNRPHDGDTARTSHVTGTDDISLSSHESDGAAGNVTFANVPASLAKRATSCEGDTSTAKSSTHYRLQRDKSREMAAKSQAESTQLLEILQREREELHKAREELEKLRVTAKDPPQVSPSVTKGNTGAAADSAGDYG